MSYDYNTSRKKLALPEYGRHIHRLVDFIVNIKDIEERNRATRALINVMGNLNPHLRDVSDFKHKLWDHLAIISDFKLEIDSPYPVPTRAILTEKPRRVPYNQGSITYKHYGKVLERMVKKATEMPDNEEKKVLIEALANLMKKQYLTWNREAVNDSNILKDLAELSKGLINISAQDMKLSETRDILLKTKKNKKIITKKNKPLN
jgi:Domain of unknown function (DUF4290)